MHKKEILLFVYNAESGLGNKALDFLHKAVSPATYSCSLCAVTYGTFRMKVEWKTFINRLPYQVEFCYKDEFRQKFPDIVDFPCIFLANSHSMHLLLGARELDKLNLEELKKVIQERLPEKP